MNVASVEISVDLIVKKERDIYTHEQKQCKRESLRYKRMVLEQKESRRLIQKPSRSSTLQLKFDSKHIVDNFESSLSFLNDVEK